MAAPTRADGAAGHAKTIFAKGTDPVNAVDGRSAAKLAQPVAEPLRAHTLLADFLRYLVAGGLAFAVDWGVLGVHYLAATALGFALGLAVNYAICVTWVWRGTRATRLRDFAVFTAIGLGGLLLTEGLMWLAVDLAGLSAPLAKLPVTGLVMVWNFGLRRLLVFFR